MQMKICAKKKDEAKINHASSLFYDFIFCILLHIVNYLHEFLA